MAKGIIVVEIPENREKCPLYDHEDGYCMGKPGKGYDHIYCLGTDTCCPIKDLPTKFENADPYERDYNSAYNCGWNDCLSEILGE